MKRRLWEEAEAAKRAEKAAAAAAAAAEREARTRVPSHDTR